MIGKISKRGIATLMIALQIVRTNYIRSSLLGAADDEGHSGQVAWYQGHRSDLDYHGSITLDPEHCEAAGIHPLEFVEIWNKNSGARISTYVIFGEAGSRCCILNGAAARTCQIGEEVIIAASEYIDRLQLCEFDPVIRPLILTIRYVNGSAIKCGGHLGRHTDFLQFIWRTVIVAN